jgi:hypothetical protein
MAQAQVATGTILGTVRDTSQAAIGGAAVTVTETDKGITLHFPTAENGDDQAPSLIPGTYSVKIEKSGFKEAIQSGVILQVDQTARVDTTVQRDSQYWREQWRAELAEPYRILGSLKPGPIQLVQRRRFRRSTAKYLWQHSKIGIIRPRTSRG